ncbi:MAG: transketolase C-terminal domain-containing protein, partial [Chloroflexota bacterium]
FATERIEDADIVIVGYGTAARIARTAMERGRSKGLRIGIFRPITLWPFPTAELVAATQGKRAILTVELSSGQMVEDVRLAIEGRLPVHFLGHQGGVLPSPNEVLEACRKMVAQ